MDFSTKQELIDFIKSQLNVELQNIDGYCGNEPDLLYAEVPRAHKNAVLDLCRKHGIETNEHVKRKYWFYLKNTNEMKGEK